MNKQQTICHKLAWWINFNPPVPLDEEEAALFGYTGPKEFNPFATTTEGRAQFAECVIKAAQERHAPMICDEYAWVGDASDGTYRHIRHSGTPESITAAFLESLFYAIGGENVWEDSCRDL